MLATCLLGMTLGFGWDGGWWRDRVCVVDTLLWRLRRCLDERSSGCIEVRPALTRLRTSVTTCIAIMYQQRSFCKTTEGYDIACI